MYMYVTKINLNGNLTLENLYTVLVGRPDNKRNGCGSGEEYECEELCLRFTISMRVMCFASSSFYCKPLAHSVRCSTLLLKYTPVHIELHLL